MPPEELVGRRTTKCSDRGTTVQLTGGRQHILPTLERARTLLGVQARVRQFVRMLPQRHTLLADRAPAR